MPDLRLWPAPPTLTRIIQLSLLATFVFFLVFQVHDRRLDVNNIVSLELAWTPARAKDILTAWGAGGQQVARESLFIDFAYMPAYAFLFAGLVLATARGVRGRLQTLGFWLSAAPFAAWVCDLTENFALLRVLTIPSDPSPAAVRLASLCASLKFELLLVCLTYILVAWILRRR